MDLRTLAPLLLAAACSHPTPTAAPVAATVPADAAPAAPTIGIAVVFEMQHLWLGNDTWWTGRASTKTKGWYGQLHDGLDRLARIDLAGAQVALIGYGNGASVRWTGPLADLTGDKLGAQASMTSVTGVNGAVPMVGMDVTAGVDEAIVDLDKMGVQEKHLIVIGDGNNGDALPHEREQLQRNDIAVTAIFLQEPLGILPGDAAGWKKLTDDVETLDDGEGLAPALAAIATTWK